MSDLELARINLSDAKDQLRVLHSHEDSYIESLILPALYSVAGYIDRDLTDPFCIGSDGFLKPELRLAALQVVGDLYKNRESQSPVAHYENKTFVNLLEKFRNLGV